MSTFVKACNPGTFWKYRVINSLHNKHRAHDNVLQQDNFRLNIEIVSTNSALSRHSVSISSSLLAEHYLIFTHNPCTVTCSSRVVFGYAVKAFSTGRLGVNCSKFWGRVRRALVMMLLHSLQYDFQYSRITTVICNRMSGQNLTIAG